MNRPETLRSNKWRVAQPVPFSIQQKLGDVHPVLLQVLYNREIREAADIQAFLEGRYLKSTDPFLLPDMERAVARIQQAVQNDERIIVYGDFDADGVTATVLLTKALRALGLSREQAQPYIPNRVDEGYGLNIDSLAKLKNKIGADLVISVDCGIRSAAEVAYAREIGLDMIITDHHSLGPQLPPAVAVVNPKRPESEYPETMLAGVGIAFKLAQALRLAMPERAAFSDEDFLDLVAVGTVADLAPLLGENRKLVQDGLRVMNRRRRPGLAALARVARLPANGLTAESIAFGIGPRINAAGRLAHAYAAAQLLASNNSVDANRLALELNDLNRERQRLTAELGMKAEAMIDPGAPILIVADAGFLSGVVGLVASRLAEKNYRPAIVIEQGEEESRGSCRSITGFHITEALDEAADLLVRYGGHAQAAGFTVRNKNLPEFVERMTEIAQQKLGELDLQPTIAIDAEIGLESIDWALHENLAQLEPTGSDNATPVFMTRSVEVASHRVVGQNGSHLQMHLSNGQNRYSGPNAAFDYSPFPAIAFRQGAWANCLPQHIDIVYTIGVNEWNGRRSLQLLIQDIRPAAT